MGQLWSATYRLYYHQTHRTVQSVSVRVNGTGVGVTMVAVSVGNTHVLFAVQTGLVGLTQMVGFIRGFVMRISKRVGRHGHGWAKERIHCTMTGRKAMHVKRVSKGSKTTRRGDKWGTLYKIVYQCEACGEMVELQTWVPHNQPRLL